MSKKRWIHAYRDALRAAREHEGSKAYLSSTFPRDSFVDGTKVEGEARGVVRDLARRARKDPGALVRALDVASRLRANLGREALYESKRKRLREREPPRPHVNLAWFLRKFDLVARRAPGGEGSPPATQDELDVVKEMIEVGCQPPRRLLEAAVQGLAASPNTFDRALEAAWIVDLRSPFVMAPESVASLVRGAINMAGGDPSRAKQAMNIWRLFLECGAAADRGLGSLAVATAACAATTVEDARGVEETICVAREKGVVLNDTAKMGLLEAYERSGQYEKAFTYMKTMNIKAQTPSAEVLLGLLDWAVHEGQNDRVEFIHNILATSGKGKYLAAMSSPSC